MLSAKSSASSDDVATLKLLLECTRLLHSTGDLAELTTIILRIVREEIGFDRGTLFVVDTARHCIRSCVAEGVADFQITLAMGSGIAGSVALSGEILDIPDTALDPRFRREFDRLLGYKTKDICCVPIVNGKGLTVGVLQLLNRPAALSEANRKFLSSISVHLGLALERAWFRHQAAEKETIERELSTLREELAHLEKLSLIGVLTASMVHEVRSPLAGLLGHTDLMKRDADLTPRQAERLKKMNLSAQAALEVVNGFLDFSRKETLPAQPASLKAAVQNSLALVRHECRRKRIAVETRIDTAPPVLAGAGHLQQVLVNLLKNAIDAIAETSPAGNVLVSCRAADGVVRVEVSDDGPGVAEDARRHLFEPFFTTKPSGRGTGLGLSVCKQLVEMYSGRIGYTPAENGGSTFWFELPESLPVRTP